jgi:hypothetical protein
MANSAEKHFHDSHVMPFERDVVDEDLAAWGFGQVCPSGLCVAQAVLYYFYDAGWTLPVAGFLVGWFTNWVALKLIFEPASPVNLGCYTLQGLFLKRQHEAAKVIAASSAEFFLVQV